MSRRGRLAALAGPASLVALVLVATAGAGAAESPLAAAGQSSPAPRGAADVDVRVRLEPAVVGSGESAVLTLALEGAGYQQPRLTPAFELDNLALAGPPASRQDVEFGSGGSRWSYVWRWRLEPLAPGPATVRELRVRVGDRTLALPDQRIRFDPARTRPAAERRAAAASPSAEARVQRRPGRLQELLDRALPGRGEALRELWPFGSEAEPRIFLDAEVTPRHPYRGQLVTYRVYLYTQLPVTGLQATRLPGFRGFWVRESRPEESQRRVLVGGQPFRRVPILVRHLVPLRAGRLEIEPLAVRLTTVEMTRRGLFGREPMRVELERATLPVAVRVEPLPPPPAAFELHAPSGEAPLPVGPLRLSASVEPPTVAAGSGALLTVVARGTGHLEAVAPPAAPETPDVRVLPPQERPVDDEVAAGTAARAWEYLLIPERPGEVDLPPVEMPYFDPTSRSYRLARAELPALRAAAPPPPVVDELPAGAVNEAEPLPRRDLFLWAAGAFVAGAAAVAGLLLLARARRRPGRRRRPLEADVARAFDAELARAVGEERPRRAAAAFEGAWRSLLETVWQVPHEAPAGRWPSELAARGLPADRARELARLVDDLQQLRHAPELAATDAVAEELARRSRRLARGLGRAATG